MQPRGSSSTQSAGYSQMPRPKTSTSLSMLPPPRSQSVKRPKDEEMMDISPAKNIKLNANSGPSSTALMIKKELVPPKPYSPFYKVRLLSGTIQQLHMWNARQHKMPPLYETAGNNDQSWPFLIAFYNHIVRLGFLIVDGSTGVAQQHPMERRFSLRTPPEWFRRIKDGSPNDDVLSCVFYTTDTNFSLPQDDTTSLRFI